MESRHEITDFVTTKKTEKSEIYKLVRDAITNYVGEFGINKSSIRDFCDLLLDYADEDKDRFEVKTHLYNLDKKTIKDIKTKESLTVNISAEHGDICPKLRGIFDLINADKEFNHFAVIVNNQIIIDDVLAGREYADRLASRAAQLVLRVAILSEKCPLQDAPGEVDEEKAEA